MNSPPYKKTKQPATAAIGIFQFYFFQYILLIQAVPVLSANLLKLFRSGS